MAIKLTASVAEAREFISISYLIALVDQKTALEGDGHELRFHAFNHWQTMIGGLVMLCTFAGDEALRCTLSPAAKPRVVHFRRRRSLALCTFTGDEASRCALSPATKLCVAHFHRRRSFALQTFASDEALQQNSPRHKFSLTPFSARQNPLGEMSGYTRVEGHAPILKVSGMPSYASQALSKLSDSRTTQFLKFPQINDLKSHVNFPTKNQARKRGPSCKQK